MWSERLQPAFWGGLFIGVLSALPIVAAGNCCCCLWVLAGGVLATYLRQQNAPTTIPASEAALIGLMAGVIGGIVAGVLSLPMAALAGPWQQELVDRVLESNPDVPPQLRDMLERGTVGAAAQVASMLITIVIDAIFGMLGGLLGIVIFKKDTPPPGTVEILPPA
jgi:hypothetical protein